MQPSSWNDLRVLLAVARAQSLSGAAGILGVNATTVSRRLKVLEDLAGRSLLSRIGAGTLQLTPLGQALADRAERMEKHAQWATAALGADEVLGGTIRLTAVPFLLNRIVAAQIDAFSDNNPSLQISLVPDSRNLSLTRREVDIALRFGEPNEGGDAILAQRLGKIEFSVFAARASVDLPTDELSWLTYDPVANNLPQAAWTEKIVRTTKGKIANLLMHDLETVLETLPHSPFCALVPRTLAAKDNRLRSLDLPGLPYDMHRDVWLMRHRDMRGVARIDAVVEWLSKARLFD